MTGVLKVAKPHAKEGKDFLTNFVAVITPTLQIQSQTGLELQIET